MKLKKIGIILISISIILYSYQFITDSFVYLLRVPLWVIMVFFGGILLMIGNLNNKVSAK